MPRCRACERSTCASAGTASDLAPPLAARPGAPGFRSQGPGTRLGPLARESEGVLKGQLSSPFWLEGVPAPTTGTTTRWARPGCADLRRLSAAVAATGRPCSRDWRHCGSTWLRQRAGPTRPRRPSHVARCRRFAGSSCRQAPTRSSSRRAPNAALRCCEIYCCRLIRHTGVLELRTAHLASWDWDSKLDKQTKRPCCGRDIYLA